MVNTRAMWLERRMGERLLAVAAWVQGDVVEKNPGPFERCQAALARVRSGWAAGSSRSSRAKSIAW